MTNIEKLRGCRVVEGSVAILLIDEVTEQQISAYSFPELVEITGYLLLYRVSGIKSLFKLFPNLAVIRGRDIFNDYSLIIYEFENLEEVGLMNLQTIQRGYVRIEKNDKLCFADRVDWSFIAGSGEHYVQKNKRHCPYCAKEMGCLAAKNENNKFLCWNQQHCQVKCNCNGNACTPSGKCCDSTCLGGCDENDIKKCIACKKFSVGTGREVVCSEYCPKGTYEVIQKTVEASEFESFSSFQKP